VFAITSLYQKHQKKFNQTNPKVCPIFKVGTGFTLRIITHHFRVLLQKMNSAISLFCPLFHCHLGADSHCISTYKIKKNVFYTWHYSNLWKLWCILVNRNLAEEYKIGLIEWVGGTQIIAFQTSYPFPQCSIFIKSI